MFCTLSFTRAHSHMHWHMQSKPHTAMHYWRLGVIMFPPAKAAYTFCHYSCHRKITVTPFTMRILPSQDKWPVLSGPGWNKGLCSKWSTSWTDTSITAGECKGRRDSTVFFRSKEAVSESSSWSACIPSISCTASWTRIRRQIPTVISQQQRGCYIVWSCVMPGPLCRLCCLWI